MIDNDPIISIQSPEEFNNEQHSTIGQQVLTTLEGASQGLAGPLATAAEAGLSKLGIPGLSAHEQELRARANPVERYGSEAAAFAGSSLLGVGEARLIGEAGNLAGKAIEGSSLAARLASSGVKAGAELSALQAGSELSKMINNDPNQTLGSAAINVGLAGLLGGAAGVGLGATSELFRNSLEKSNQFINEVKERAAFRQALEAGEITPEMIPEETLKDSIGHKVADWAFEKGQSYLHGLTGDAAGAAVGAGIGSIVGHPFIGGYIGKKALGPIMESLTKPMIESVTNADALKGSIDYLSNAIKGNELLNKSVESLVKAGETLPKNLLPSKEDRNQLNEKIASLDSPDKVMGIGGQVGHLLPQHMSALGMLVAQTKTALDQQKPPTQSSSPWTGTTPLSSLQKAKYDRLLDIAQQPLMPLHYAANGTLTAKDVSDFNAIHPGIAKAVASKITAAVIEAKSTGQNIPYNVRLNLAKLTGQPLDASITPVNSSMIMSSALPQQQSNKTAGGKHLHGNHTTEAQLKQIDQTTKLAATRTQAREAAEAQGKA